METLIIMIYVTILKYVVILLARYDVLFLKYSEINSAPYFLMWLRVETGWIRHNSEKASEEISLKTNESWKVLTIMNPSLEFICKFTDAILSQRSFAGKTL